MNLGPARLNREMSAGIQAEAEKKLGRSLTADEEYCIWNHGSFMGLDMISMAIYYAKSPTEVEKYLDPKSSFKTIQEIKLKIILLKTNNYW